MVLGDLRFQFCIRSAGTRRQPAQWALMALMSVLQVAPRKPRMVLGTWIALPRQYQPSGPNLAHYVRRLRRSACKRLMAVDMMTVSLCSKRSETYSAVRVPLPRSLRPPAYCLLRFLASSSCRNRWRLTTLIMEGRRRCPCRQCARASLGKLALCVPMLVATGLLVASAPPVRVGFIAPGLIVFATAAIQLAMHTLQPRRRTRIVFLMVIATAATQLAMHIIQPRHRARIVSLDLLPQFCRLRLHR